MGRKRKQREPKQAAGAPEWMVTFSDCMTLLLTFFVLLLSFSSFDDRVFRQLKIIFASTLPSIKAEGREIKNADAFLPTRQITDVEDIDKGSEKPTLERGVEDGLKEDTESVNVHKRKVFLISSGKIFYGNGKVISLRGRKTLSAVAAFLREMPNRVVISENGPENEKVDEYFGLQRAWAVLKYFAAKPDLDKGKFSVSASTLQEGLRRNQQGYSKTKTGRVLEIVLLERSICN
ncbi:MAG: flagellar motor protein MotB [Planctomycetota bacterium]|jgi:chemotaxis protein MotB